MIKIVEGNLLDAKEDIIGHQVNCKGKMGSGVALQIKEKYPLAFSKYQNYIKNKRSNVGSFYVSGMLLGNCQIVYVGDENNKPRFVANLFGQDGYGYNGRKYTDEDSLFESLVKLRTEAEEYGKSVALPYNIGCDRGGGDWSKVEKLILKAFEGYQVTLYKYDGGK